MLSSWSLEPPGMWIKDYFDTTPDFVHMKLLKSCRYPWEVVKGISDYIIRWLEECDIEPTYMVDWGSIEGEYRNGSLYVKRSVCLDRTLFLKELGIYIGKETVLEPTVFIKSSTIIGDNCEIRHGTYLRGNIIIGGYTVIGHTTEVKNSIFMNHSEAGHFSYIGDSIIGNYVNLGAGTKLANLEFRTLEEKRSGEKKTIKIKYRKEIIDTQMAKLGAIIGDGGELGCNSVTSPGVILGKNSIVYPTINVRKGFYLQKSNIKVGK